MVGIPGVMLEMLGLSAWVQKCLGLEGLHPRAHVQAFRDSFVSPVNTRRLWRVQKVDGVNEHHYWVSASCTEVRA